MKLDQVKNIRVNEILDYALSLVPGGIAEEIKRVSLARCDCPEGISEIRIRSVGVSSLVISGENVKLQRRVSDSEMADIFDKITSGSPYAFERELSEGYVTSRYGIRIGVAMSEIKSESRIALSIVFRLPLAECSYGEELFGLWQKKGGGMLLYSPPGAGKTTALASVAKSISEKKGKKVVIVDERGEFPPESFCDTCVDIIRGYPKAKGIEIAVRTLGAEVTVTDEIGGAGEARQIELFGRGGIPFIASAHADTLRELYSKRTVAPLIEQGFFSTLVRLFKDGAKFGFEVEDDAEDAQ